MDRFDQIEIFIGVLSSVSPFHDPAIRQCAAEKLVAD
jgi:hypothetical protein